MFNKRIVIKMADQLEAYDSTLRKLRYAKSTYNDYLKKIKLSRDETKVRKQDS